MVQDLVISAREAPQDFPDALPQVPPTADEITQLLELWTNVVHIGSLRSETWNDVQRSEYMIWTTDDNRQFRVIWDSDANAFWTCERTNPSPDGGTSFG